MNRKLIFKKLWLLSEKESKGKVQLLNEGKTLLLGKNGTGKSRITKNLFWVFGCEPNKRNMGKWDPDTIAGLDFSFGDEEYFVIRRGKKLALFDANSTLLFTAETMSEWEQCIGPFFGYNIFLPRHYGQLSQAGMGYLTLPFYIDQDGSWGGIWNTYSDLGQFKGWQKTVLEAFVGLRPNAYFLAKQKKDAIRRKVVEKEREFDSHRVAFERVQELLPKNLPSLNFSTFRLELAELGRKLVSLQRSQVSLRSKLTDAVNIREKTKSELRLALAAHKEQTEDLMFLSELGDTSLECPTCGTMHLSSFHARLQLSQESDSLMGLILELRKKSDNSTMTMTKLSAELREIGSKINKIDMVTSEKRNRLKLEDVLASHSKKTLDTAFYSLRKTLLQELDVLVRKEALETDILKKYEDKERAKAVGRYFSDQVSSLSNLLNVPADEQLVKPKPSERNYTGGSSAPRSLLAVHLALINTNVEYGDTPLFPFVVDTPQQSGQDYENLESMIEGLANSAGKEHQVVLAVETLPPNVNIKDFEVFEFKSKNALLNAADFNIVMNRISSPMLAMLEALIDKSRESASLPE